MPSELNQPFAVGALHQQSQLLGRHHGFEITRRHLKPALFLNSWATLLRSVLGDKRNRRRLAIAAMLDSFLSPFGLAQILRKPILKRKLANP